MKPVVMLLCLLTGCGSVVSEPDTLIIDADHTEHEYVVLCIVENVKRPCVSFRASIADRSKR